MKEILRILIESSLATRISIGAFVLSLISLWITVRNQSRSIRLESAEKKTSFLVQYLRALDRLRIGRGVLASIRESCIDCTKCGIDTLISKYDILLNKVKDGFCLYDENESIDSIRWESAMPQLHAVLSDVEFLIKDAEAISQLSKACDKKVVK